ncbi:hypothetical protein [Catenulispora pinisilvae]|uniref:hypothetical protein n=1 Tax=Catenulispora pinisilvae TaxID=2705253 RepID=UPI0018911783|nr:hypothetical protein [Catenulispora pinisilvae]
MIQHTMIVSFTESLPDGELDRYLTDIERALLATGHVQSVASAHHIAVPGEEQIPALIATAIVQVSVADHEALTKTFAAPEIGAVIDEWRGRHPYKVGWANHEPLG